MLRFLLIFVLCCLAFGLEAQLSLGHGRLVQPVHKLEVKSMPSVDNKSLLEIELHNHQNDRPVHFAQPFDVDINPEIGNILTNLLSGESYLKVKLLILSILASLNSTCLKVGNYLFMTFTLMRGRILLRLQIMKNMNNCGHR